MFSRFLSHLQMRRSTAFLLERGDERLLDDIGLSRAELEAMHLGLGPSEARTKVVSFLSLPLFNRLPA
jgi:hypothetical protein